MKNIMIMEMNHILNKHSDNPTLESIEYEDFQITFHIIGLLHVFIVVDTENDRYRVMKSRNIKFHDKIFYGIEKMKTNLNDIEEYL